jgi:hypothetical protein
MATAIACRDPSLHLRRALDNRVITVAVATSRILKLFRLR